MAKRITTHEQETTDKMDVKRVGQVGGPDIRHVVDDSEPASHVPSTAEKGKGKATVPGVQKAPIAIGDGDREAESIKAIISVNVFNILMPPVPIEFGEFNPRPLVKSGVTALVEKFTNDAFTPFRMDSMIPIHLHLSDLDASCRNMDFTRGADAPPLRLSTQSNISVLKAFGGRHRHAASQKIYDDCTETLKSLRDDLNSLEGRKGKGKGEGSSKGRSKKAAKVAEDVVEGTGLERSERIGEIQEKISAVEDDRRRYTTWGVVVYDSGAYITDAQHVHS
jgi:hypothetical protein